MKNHSGMNFLPYQKPQRIESNKGKSNTLFVLGWLAAMLFMFVSAQAQTAPVSYGIVSMAAGNAPAAAKIGDLDGDGLSDIAVINTDGNLQLFFNGGAGAFERISLSVFPSAALSKPDLEIGDLNGDGRQDLVVSGAADSSVYVLLNQGGGVFSAPVGYNSCGVSNALAIGDLDGDGDSDLAEVSRCNRAGILTNNGSGVFAFNGAFGTGAGTKSIALADFNGDNFKDIVYLNGEAPGSRSVTLLFNNRNGTFGNPVTNYGGGLPSDLTTGDFDNDGGTDIAVANAYFSQIIMLFLNRSGAFIGYSELDGGDTPDGIVSADLNNDGRLDMVVTSRNNNRLSAFLNRGNYYFDGPFSFGVGQSPVDLAAGRLDADDFPDLVTVNQAAGTVSLLLSATPPPPAPRISLTGTPRTTFNSKIVELSWSGATTSSVEIFRNNVRLGSFPNNGRYSDQLNRRTRGTFNYQICQSGGQVCSNTTTINFY